VPAHSIEVLVFPSQLVEDLCSMGMSVNATIGGKPRNAPQKDRRASFSTAVAKTSTAVAKTIKLVLNV